MTKTKMSRYLGRNGIITSPILLEKVEPIPMMLIVASPGKVLTNGDVKVKEKMIFANELNEWSEIDDI